MFPAGPSERPAALTGTIADAPKPVPALKIRGESPVAGTPRAPVGRGAAPAEPRLKPFRRVPRPCFSSRPAQALSGVAAGGGVAVGGAQHPHELGEDLGLGELEHAGAGLACGGLLDHGEVAPRQ